MLIPGPRIGSGCMTLGGEGKGVVIRDLGIACRDPPIRSASTGWMPVPRFPGVLGVELLDKGEGGLDLCTSFFNPVPVCVRRWWTSLGGVRGGDEKGEAVGEPLGEAIGEGWGEGRGEALRASARSCSSRAFIPSRKSPLRSDARLVGGPLFSAARSGGVGVGCLELCRC